jgi:hypothetical protein
MHVPMSCGGGTPRSIRIVLVLLTVPMLGGCGGDTKSYPVRGKVLVFETGILPGGEVRFRSTSDYSLIGIGSIKKDGSFSLSIPEKGEGLPPGRYRAAVVAPSSKGRRLFHERFESFDTSDLQYTVTARDENYFFVELKRSAK